MPASVAFDAMLLQGEDVAVFLSGLRVHSTGIAFKIDVRARRGLRSDDEEYVDPFFGRGARQVLVGVELPDGRRTSNLGPRRFDDAADGPVLHQGGGGGGGRSAEADYFLTPLPPAGEVTLVCAWPSRGLGETLTVLPTAEIRQVAARVVELWPWEPEEPEPGVWKPRVPDVPEGSWFASEVAALRRADPPS